MIDMDQVLNVYGYREEHVPRRAPKGKLFYIVHPSPGGSEPKVPLPLEAQHRGPNFSTRARSVSGRQHVLRQHRSGQFLLQVR